MRVLIVVTHLLGTGHLARAQTLARAFDAAGHDVRLVSGGMPVPHFDQPGDPLLLQLPPLRSDGTNFSRLLDAAGNDADPARMKVRRDALDTVIQTHRPDVLITELFPFGRRNLKDEFEHLLESARSQEWAPLIFASIRDILAPPSKRSKVEYANRMFERYYDGVLVHSDSAVVPLSLSWPVEETPAAKLHYTGFVAPPPPVALDDDPGDEVLVSAGGGPVGAAIFAAALDAARRDPRDRWRLFVPDETRPLLGDIPQNVLVVAPDPQFRRRLCRAAASVSMCGYNTALDVLQTGIPAVFIPFDVDGEVEQGLRAEALAARPGIVTLLAKDLSGDTLLSAVRTARNAPSRPPVTEGMDGGAATVRFVEAQHRRAST